MNRSSFSMWIRSALCAMLLAGCFGDIGRSGNNNDAAPTPNPGDPSSPEPPTCDSVCVGSSQMMRLTRPQYSNAVKGLFGSDIQINWDALPADQRATVFRSNEGVHLTESETDLLLASAEHVATQVSEDLEGRVPCDPATGDLACVNEFVASVLPRAYRRSATDEELAAYNDLASWVLEEGDFAEAIFSVVATVLQSPNFLVRVENATDAPTLLNPFEMAARLSFFLWDEGPDEELLQAAAAGELQTEESVAEHARRLLADTRADTMIRRFHQQWLGTEHIDTLERNDPEFATVAADLRRETNQFVVHALRQGDGRLETLLSADYTLLNDNLANYYGVPAPDSGFSVTSVPERRGLLTQGSVLAIHGADGYTSPIYRGILVRTRFLCDRLGSRPDDVGSSIEMRSQEAPENASERELLDYITGAPECAQCHTLVNPIGYGLSSFDSAGRFRATDDEGKPIDNQAVLEGTHEYATDVDGSFRGASELVTKLAQSETVAACVAQQWMTYALQRLVDDDAYSHYNVYQAFRESDYNIFELLVAITTSDAFRHRAAAP